MRATLAFCFALALSFPLAAAAEVVDSSLHGFTSRSTSVIPASSADVYDALVGDVGSWWSSDHTFSGDSANLGLEAKQGGCFCEALPNGGSVRHLTVVNADPGKLLRLTGGLGPLQAAAVTGALTWELSDAGAGTEITVTYTVGGYVPGGLDSWAAPVDGVVGEQLERLARFVETGNPAEPGSEPTSGNGSAR